MKTFAEMCQQILGYVNKNVQVTIYIAALKSSVPQKIDLCLLLFSSKMAVKHPKLWYLEPNQKQRNQAIAV